MSIRANASNVRIAPARVLASRNSKDGGHAKTVSDRGYALSVAGTRVTKTQRLSGKVPKEAVVVSNVRLGGGLAADYHNLAQEVMEGIVERLAPQPAAASSAKDANGN